MKLCTKCKKPRRRVDFYKNSQNKDGLRFECKPCVKLYNEKHREEINEYYRKYRKANLEKVTGYVKSGKKLIKNLYKYIKKYIINNISWIIREKFNFTMKNIIELTLTSITRIENERYRYVFCYWMVSLNSNGRIYSV